MQHRRHPLAGVRVVQVTVAVVAAALMVAAASAQEQATTPKQLSWKDRAKLDYQRRYEKYILHKKDADEDNIIVGDGGSESNVIPLGTRGSLPVAPPPPSTRPPPPVTRPAPPPTRPPPPPPPPTRPPPPPPTRPPPPPPTRPPPPPTRPPTPSTPAFRPPPPSPTTPPPPPPPSSTTTTRQPPPPPPPPTPAYRPPPPPPSTTPRPPPPSTRRPVEVTDAVPQVGIRSGFPSASVPQSVPTGGSASSGVASAGAQQGTVSGTFSRPAPPSANGGSFASSSATAFSSGGVQGGSSSSNAGTFSPAGTAVGTFSFNVGGGSSASGSTTAVNKSPVALLGKVVQGIVRPITSILPAPLGPKGSNPGIVGGLVSGIFEELDGGLRAIYPGTLWCGAGNVARSDDEVGVFQSTDRCCRRHDNCPDSIAAGAAKHGLRNTGTFTRSHCDCDELFYKCLKADRKSIVSVKVGTTYFNLLRPRCFRAVSPCAVGSAGNCTATYRWFNNRIF